MQSLKRYPYKNNDLLQAWDAADELLLNHLKEKDLRPKKILIINDQFGAISSSLLDLSPVSYTDSYVSFKGTEINTEGRVLPLNNLTDIKNKFDLVLIQLPKNLSYFEDILCHFASTLDQGSEFIFTGMIKHMAPGHFDLINKYIGATTTSLAVKKARLIFAKLEKEATPSPYPLEVSIDGFEKKFINHSNLFSREKLDIGTRFMLDNIPKGNFQKVLDLGCGNGLLGIKTKMLNPSAHITFTDESFMAIKSAKANYESHFSDNASFYWMNSFEESKTEEFDLVLCNPPFHQSNTVGDFIALQMFKDAKRVLRKGGVLRVIGNSHLGYQVKLKGYFGNSKIVNQNQKFMIIDSIKS